MLRENLRRGATFMRRCYKEFLYFSQNTSQQWRISTPRTSRSETPPWRWTSWTRPGTTSSPWWGGSPSAQVQIYTFIDLFLWSGRNGGEKILDNDWLIMPQYSQREFCQYVKRDQECDAGHAFLLVYSVTCPDSLKMIHTRLEEIKSQRSDFKASGTVFL